MIQYNRCICGFDFTTSAGRFHNCPNIVTHASDSAGDFAPLEKVHCKNCFGYIERVQRLESEVARLAEEVGRYKKALEKCREQRDSSMGDYTLNRFDKIEALRKSYDAEIQSILAGGET